MEKVIKELTELVKTPNKLKKLVDFIEKYDFKTFVIAMEHNGIQFEDISKDKYGDYILEYVIGEKTIKQSLIDLSDDIIDDLIECCEQYGRFEVESHLEIGIGIDPFIKILKKHKEPIKFNGWMFGMIIESDLQDKVNSFEFQNILFSTHPEAFTSFMDEYLEEKERAKKYHFDPLEIAPGIEKKFKKLFDDYKTTKDSEKYNL